MPSIIVECFVGNPLEHKIIIIKVPCEYRAACYKDLLNSTFEEIYVYLNGKEEKERDLIINAVLNPHVLENFAQALDNILLDFLIADIEEYTEKEWKEINIRELTKEDSRKLLIEYYQHPTANLLLKDHLAQKYSMLDELFHAVKISFDTNIKTAMDRALVHYSALARKFLHCKWPQQKPVLVKINFSHGDKHKQGAQVLILEFQLPHSHRVHKLVYKPSSVKADALIIGKTSALNQDDDAILPSFEGESITELINKYLPKRLQLPTYLIYPCVSDTIKNDYGFLEYVEHEPWPELSLNETIKNFYENVDFEKNNAGSDQVYIDRLFANKLEQLYQEALRKGTTIDYIITEAEKKAYQHYSEQCGLLLAILLVFKISDIHADNLIVHSKKPYLIDLEFAFQPPVHSVAGTGCLNKNTGAMATLSKSPFTWKYLETAAGVKVGQLELHSKNRLYKRIAENHFEPCKPDETFLKEGFRKVIHIFHEHNQHFVGWLDRKIVHSLTVRVIPFSTKTLQEISNAIFQSLSKNEWEFCLNAEVEKLTSQWLNDLKDKNQAWLTEWQKLKANHSNQIPKTVPVFVRPDFAAAMFPYFRKEYLYASLPSFYGKITETTIYTALGVLIETKFKQLRKSGYLQEVDKELIKAIHYEWGTNHYYAKSPYVEVYEFLLSLANIEQVQWVIQTTNQHLNSFYGKSAARIKQLQEPKELEPKEQPPSSFRCRIM